MKNATYKNLNAFDERFEIEEVFVFTFLENDRYTTYNDNIFKESNRILISLELDRSLNAIRRQLLKLFDNKEYPEAVAEITKRIENLKTIRNHN